MTDPAPWMAAVRQSHDGLAGLVAGMAPEDLGQPSACSEWSVAQVLSHLGSQAEIFSLFVDAGLSGGGPPPREAFAPIWDAWNARLPADQATRSVAANEAFVSRLEGLDAGALGGFRLEMFGRTIDAAGLLRMRLSEHAVHTWDVAIAFDPSAVVRAEAVELLVDGLGESAARSGKAPDEPIDVTVITTAPDRRFSLRTSDEVHLEATDRHADAGGSIELPAEAFLRLVYGRLDDNHPPQGPVRADGVSPADLINVFRGF
ncbi:MAG TPA: maleylpyruvate isomerase family mycothiol-dependent enzyme [Acidimicrobiales bacterium]|jgi:uncharacterized protein (TIGR03083 family)|nr:maleylpyruvate isomerase family mycothiol-dependent enzyme [Acidimicrobiales bacterium]